jgi:hypothetical protein
MSDRRPITAVANRTMAKRLALPRPRRTGKEATGRYRSFLR